MVMNMKMAAFWNSEKCSNTKVDHILQVMMDAVCTSETSVNLYETTQHNISDDSHLLNITQDISMYHQQNL